jgi:hypothetical protein
MVHAFDDRTRKTRVEQVIDQFFGKSAREQELPGRALSVPCKQRKRPMAIGGTIGDLRDRHSEGSRGGQTFGEAATLQQRPYS